MILPYTARLVCLCLSCFFLAHVLSGCLAALAAPAVLRGAARRTPRSAARLLLLARLAPAAAAILSVACIGLPSYLRFEPDAAAEDVGLRFLGVAAIGFLAWAAAAGRIGWALWKSQQFLRECRGKGRQLRVAGERRPLFVVESGAPLIALAGVFHTRVVVSRAAVQALSRRELEMAILHEQAHRKSWDNMKRLLMLATPDVLPFLPVLRGLERGWARFAEWAADDAAVAGNPHRSVLLAGTLVHAARVGSVAAPLPLPLATTLLFESDELQARVDRLLAEPMPVRRATLRATILFGVSAAGAVVAVANQSGVLGATHRLLEALMR